METEEETPRPLARVGLRWHTMTSERVYIGQPEIALCGTIIIQNEGDVPESTPDCYECTVREAQRLSQMAEEIFKDSDALFRRVFAHKT